MAECDCIVCQLEREKRAAQPQPIRFRARVVKVHTTGGDGPHDIYPPGTLGRLVLDPTNPRRADDVEALRGETVWVSLEADSEGKGGD